jgi:hypothetical protein
MQTKVIMQGRNKQRKKKEIRLWNNNNFSFYFDFGIQVIIKKRVSYNALKDRVFKISPNYS